MSKIQDAVAEKIIALTKSNPVSDIVVGKLADVEISKRVDSITKAVQKLETLEKEYKKVNRPDLITYVGDEKKEATSEARFKEIAKAKQNVENLEKAINAALEKNDTDSYNKLNGTLGGGGNKEKSAADSEQE